MKAVIHVFLAVLWCLFPSTTVAQTALDELQKQYSKTKPQTKERFEITGRYAQSLFFHNQTGQSLHILKENLNAAEASKNYQYIAYLSAVSAIQHRILDQKDEMARYLKQAKHAVEKISDKETKGYVQYAEGWLYLRDDRETDAVRCFQQAVDSYDQAPQTEQLFGRQNAVYKELASIYLNWKEFELSNKYIKRTLATAKKQQDPMRLFDAYMLMGYAQEQQFNHDPSDTTRRDQAEYFYKEAVSTYQNNKNKMAVPSDLAFGAVNLANLYLQSYPDTYDAKALEYAQFAFDIAHETEQYSLAASAYGIMSDLATKEGRLEDAKNYLLAALSTVNKTSMADNTTSMNIFLNLSEVYEKEGDYAKAVHYYKQYVHTFESVFNAEKLAQSRRLEAQFDKERQRQQLIRARLEAEKQEQEISLIRALAGQQEQELQNLKLRDENQKRQLEIAQLEAQRRTQELQLSRLESGQRTQELLDSQRELDYKSRLNTVYSLLAFALFFALSLLLYAYRQRSRTLKQEKEVHQLELQQEKQNSRISNLTAMLKGEEAERARLARDLHDGLGGILSGTKMSLSRALEKNDTDFGSAVSKSISQLDMAVDELRRAAHNLMPELLLKYGLKEALREYASRMSSSELEISAQFVHFNPELDVERQILVYRIIQELVTNAVKHAEASQILIQLTDREGKIQVTVEDNGKGFDKEKLNSINSAGMHNIESRLQFLKGDIVIDSQAGLGTTVEFEFPSVKETP